DQVIALLHDPVPGEDAAFTEGRTLYLLIAKMFARGDGHTDATRAAARQRLNGEFARAHPHLLAVGAMPLVFLMDEPAEAMRLMQTRRRLPSASSEAEWAISGFARLG